MFEFVSFHVSITAFNYKIYFLKFGVIDQLTVQYKLTQTAEMIKQSVNMIILSRFFCLSNPKYFPCHLYSINILCSYTALFSLQRFLKQCDPPTYHHHTFTHQIMLIWNCLAGYCKMLNYRVVIKVMLSNRVETLPSIIWKRSQDF